MENSLLMVSQAALAEACGSRWQISTNSPTLLYNAQWQASLGINNANNNKSLTSSRLPSVLLNSSVALTEWLTGRKGLEQCELPPTPDPKDSSHDPVSKEEAGARSMWSAGVPHHPFKKIFPNFFFNISTIEPNRHKALELTQARRHFTAKWFFSVKTANILLQMILSKMAPPRLGVPKGCSTLQQYVKLNRTATTKRRRILFTVGHCGTEAEAGGSLWVCGQPGLHTTSSRPELTPPPKKSHFHGLNEPWICYAHAHAHTRVHLL